MYVRNPQGRFPRAVSIPQNYAGNAFREPIEAPEGFAEGESEKMPKRDESNAEKADGTNTAPAALLGKEKSEKNSLLPLGSLNIGSEDLLLIGLIILMASDGGGNDLLYLLILLLFLK